MTSRWRPTSSHLYARRDLSNNANPLSLIPQLEFGIEFFRDILSATVFLDLDTFAELELTGTAQADQGASPASASAQACVDLSTGFAVNAGARGSFPGLFDDSTHVTLFNKDFELFKVCDHSRFACGVPRNCAASDVPLVGCTEVYRCRDGQRDGQHERDQGGDDYLLESACLDTGGHAGDRRLESCGGGRICTQTSPPLLSQRRSAHLVAGLGDCESQRVSGPKSVCLLAD